MQKEDPEDTQHPAPVDPTPPTRGIGAPKRPRGAIPSLASGLIGACLAFLPVVNLVAFIPGIVAIVFGIQGVRATRQDPLLKGRSIAVTGLVLGGLVLVYTIVLLYTLFFIIGLGEFLDDLRARSP